ncbi:hypothetical protein HDU98_006298 [Podochytrium sp. JEL0797]|nr:hypothetical protein HDU98_006298 [Podochytrium sp. JEL0797]
MERTKIMDPDDASLTSKLAETAATLDERTLPSLHERVLAQEATIQNLEFQIAQLTQDRTALENLNESHTLTILSLKHSNQLLLKRSVALIEFQEIFSKTAKAYNEVSTQLRMALDASVAEETKTLEINALRPPEETSDPHSEIVHQPAKKDRDPPPVDFPNLEMMQKFPLFASFPRSVMEQIEQCSYEQKKKEGQIIVNKGEEGAEMFFILEGCVSVIVDGKELSRLEKPVFFGELGLLFKIKRTATIKAKTDCRLAIVTKQKVDEIIDASGSAACGLIMDEFVTSKEKWWKQQLYIHSQEKFIDKLAIALKCILYKPGEFVININDDADAMYFVLGGMVEVVGSTGVVHVEIGPGFFFGEVGILLDMKRTASIRAKAADEFADMEPTASVSDQFDVEAERNVLSKLSFFNGVEKSVIKNLAWS